MKWLPPLCALAGIILGSGIVLLVPSLQPSHYKWTDAQSDLDRQQSKIGELQTEITRIEAEKKGAQEEQEGLRRKIAVLEQQLKNSAPEKPASSPMISAATRFFKQQTDSKVLALKNRLKLTPEQETSLRRYFEEQAKGQEEITAAILAGKKISPEEMAKKGGLANSPEEQLKQILTPDQMKAYAEFQKEEKSQQLELAAHHGTNEISSLFALNEDQKDKVYGILYAQYDFKPETKGVDSKQMIAETARQRHEHLKGQLKEVLSPEQLAIWSQRNEEKMKAQLEMTKKLMAP